MLPKIDSVAGLQQYLAGIRYDNGTPDEEYIVRTPEQVAQDKIAVCYDMVELERHYFEQWQYPFQTIFFHSGDPTDPRGPATHTALVYKMNPNAEVFFLPTSMRTDNTERSANGRYFHVGIIYQGRVCEIRSGGQPYTSAINEQRQALVDHGAVFVPVVVNPDMVESQLVAGLDCGAYVARCLGLAGRHDRRLKAFGPDALYRYAQARIQRNWMWFESSWQSFRGFHGPYTDPQAAINHVRFNLQSVASGRPYRAIKYDRFDYEGMNLNEFAQHIWANRTGGH